MDFMEQLSHTAQQEKKMLCTSFSKTKILKGMKEGSDLTKAAYHKIVGKKKSSNLSDTSSAFFHQYTPEDDDYYDMSSLSDSEGGVVEINKETQHNYTQPQCHAENLTTRKTSWNELVYKPNFQN